MSDPLVLVQAISADFVERLAESGLPPLTVGGIQMGPQYLAENQNTAPAVTFVPRGSIFTAPSQGTKGPSPLANSSPSPIAPAVGGSGVLGIILTAAGNGYVAPVVGISAPDIAGGVNAVAVAYVGEGGILAYVSVTNPGTGYLNPPVVLITDGGPGVGAAGVSRLAPSPEALAEIQTRALDTDMQHFDVYIRGVTFTAGKPTPNPDTDYGFSKLMYQCLKQTMQALMAGRHKFDRGTWASGEPGATLVDSYGRTFVVTLAIDTPTLDVTLPFVPRGTMAEVTVQLAGG